MTHTISVDNNHEGEHYLEAWDQHNDGNYFWNDITGFYPRATNILCVQFEFHTIVSDG